MLASFDRKLAVKAEKAVDSLFFKYIETEELKSDQTGLVSLNDSELANFEINGQTNRRFNF